ncbi:unnamed protein product [Symbiodinium pilosum]|uniref:Uncharacterized protein n=1 Tax=Symbiodinium pilosum TaxID=2952 RepID=A0A812PFC7_SYMPI|nr:unnamed protein product [Symbiodinium pilosum]
MAYDALVRSMIAGGIPKILILIWNSECPLTPRYDCLDLFSGKGSVKEALVAAGFVVASHDIELSPTMDVTSAAGMA